MVVRRVVYVGRPRFPLPPALLEARTDGRVELVETSPELDTLDLVEDASLLVVNLGGLHHVAGPSPRMLRIVRDSLKLIQAVKAQRRPVVLAVASGQPTVAEMSRILRAGSDLYVTPIASNRYVSDWVRDPDAMEDLGRTFLNSQIAFALVGMGADRPFDGGTTVESAREVLYGRRSPRVPRLFTRSGSNDRLHLLREQVLRGMVSLDSPWEAPADSTAEPERSGILVGPPASGVGGGGDNEAGGGPTAEAPSEELFWTTGFPDRPDLTHEHADKRGPVDAGAMLDLVTALGPDEGGGVVQAVPATETMDRMVSYEVDGDGVLFSVDGGPAVVIVASEVERCTAMGVGPFAVTCHVGQVETATVRLTLRVDGYPLAHQRIDLRVLGRDLGDKTTGREALPVPPSGGVATRITAELIATFEQPDLLLSIDATGKATLRILNGQTHYMTLGIGVASRLAPAVAAARKELNALTLTYPEEVVGFDLGPDTAATVQTFSSQGAALHELLFGSPHIGAVSLVLAIAARGSYDQPPALVIEDQLGLPVLWELLYDEDAEAAAIATDMAVEEAVPSSVPGTTVRMDRFWGARFRISHVHPVTGERSVPGGERAMTALVNPHFDEPIVARQRAALDATTLLQLTARHDTAETFGPWVKEGGPACDLLYLFCHATSPTEYTPGRTGLPAVAAEVNAESWLALSEDGTGGRITLEELFQWWRRPRERQPIVLLNACGTGVVDPIYGAPFVRFFLEWWLARTLLATSWSVPTAFADEFSRGILTGLDAGEPIGLVVSATARRAFAVGNPYPLVYTLYGQCDSRVM